VGVGSDAAAAGAWSLVRRLACTIYCFISTFCELEFIILLLPPYLQCPHCCKTDAQYTTPLRPPVCIVIPHAIMIMTISWVNPLTRRRWIGACGGRMGLGSVAAAVGALSLVRLGLRLIRCVYVCLCMYIY